MNIKIYGADWSLDCTYLKNLLISKKISFEYIVITNNHDALVFLEKVNNGKRVIPTVDINGKIFSNPGINELMKIITE